MLSYLASNGSVYTLWCAHHSVLTKPMRGLTGKPARFPFWCPQRTGAALVRMLTCPRFGRWLLLPVLKPVATASITRSYLPVRGGSRTVSPCMGCPFSRLDALGHPPNPVTRPFDQATALSATRADSFESPR